MYILGVIVGGIISWAIFHPIYRDHDFERNVNATMYRYHARYGR